MEVRFFDEKVKQFIQTLEEPTIAKILRMIDLLKQFEHRLTMPHSRSLGGGLFELRIRGNQEVRLLYAFHQDRAVILHGFLKKSEKIPKQEIETAYRKLSTLDSV